VIRLRVREIIEAKKINQSQLSRKADIPINTIQSMVRNEYHDPRISTLEKLAKALGVRIEDLYEIIEEA
jgi:transcriptional regulator with XRE-family HTH domain